MPQDDNRRNGFMDKGKILSRMRSLHIVWMKNWNRSLQYSADTGLPWVMPSPNMPTLQTALVYPGTVLIEALNLSEGRGTTIPFELFGAPFINAEKLKKES